MALQLAKVYVSVRGDNTKLTGDLMKSKGIINNTFSRLGIAGGRQFSSSVTKASKGLIAQMAAIGTLAGKTFMTSMGAAITLGPGILLVGIAKSGETFNRSMRNSLAIMGDLTRAMKEDMTEAAIKAASTTQFSAAQTAEAYFFLASAGLNAQQSIAALPQVTKFAQAGMFDMAKATSLAANAQSAMGLKVKDAQQNLANLTRVTDVLVKANTLADATTQQFSEAITTKAGGAARIAGKEIEELVATLAVLADQGVKGAEAGTALNIVYRDLQTKSLKFAKNFENMGIRVWETNGAMRNMADIIADLERSMERLSAKQRKQELLQLGFQDRSIVFTQLLIGMSEKMREFERRVSDAGGTTQEVADKQLTPLQKGLAQIGAAIIKVGSEFMKWAGPILGNALTKLSGWFKYARAGFILLGQFVSSFVSNFVDGITLGFNNISALFKPFIGNWNEMFTTIADNLDTFFGSWEGFRKGILTGWKSLTVAIANLWEGAFDYVAKTLLELNTKIESTINKIKTEAKVQVVRARQFMEAPNMFAGETRKQEEERLMRNAAEIGRIRAAGKVDEEKRLETHNVALKILNDEHAKRVKSISDQFEKDLLDIQKGINKLPKLSDRFRDLLKENKVTEHLKIKFDEITAPKIDLGGAFGGAGSFGTDTKGGRTGFGDLGKAFQDMIIQNAKDEVPKEILKENKNQVMELQKIDQKMQRSLEMDRTLGLV